MAPSDDAFWREQAKRHQDLEQPCCTQSQMSWALVDLPGALAVVVHGESDCLNSFFHHLGRNAASYYGTRLTDRELALGQTQEPLRELLELLVQQRRPEAVLVLGTCPVELIDDPFEEVVGQVAAATGVPMLALRTHGLAMMSQARCQDWLYAELANLSPPSSRRPESINLIGLHRGAEIAEARQLFEGLGLQINGSYPSATSLREWRTITAPPTSFVVDREMFPQLVRRLEGAGQQVVEVPVPVGLEQTARFYRTVAESLDRAGDMEQALAALLEAERPGFERLAERVRGQRLAMCIRMYKTHRSERLAYEGLGDLPLLRNLGFELAIMVQGPPEPQAREAFAKRLHALGHGQVPFDVFQGPWELGERLREGGFDVAVMSDVARNVVERAGVQMIPGGALRPFFCGMASNLRLIRSAVGQRS